MARRTTPKMRKALPMGRAAHGASLGVPGMVPPGEPARRLQEPAPGFRCSYPPAGRCWASVPGHRHVRRHQCDAAPTRIAAAICRAVTAAGVTAPSASRQAQWPRPGSSGCAPGAVGSIPLSAVHLTICPMGSDDVFNMRRICSRCRCATSRDAGFEACLLDDGEGAGGELCGLLLMACMGVCCGEDLRAAQSLKTLSTAFLINP